MYCISTSYTIQSQTEIPNGREFCDGDKMCFRLEELASNIVQIKR